MFNLLVTYARLSATNLTIKLGENWLAFIASAFLVSVPVFFQAPLVRLFPWFSLSLTGVWLSVAIILFRSSKNQLWGDLLIGFTWSWLAGSIYWGWLRHEPLIHLPIESIGLPFAIWCLFRSQLIIGNFFYLGSLLGTAITDLYFYLTDLIPYWRQVMIVETDLVPSILQNALNHIQNPWGISWVIVLANLLLAIALYAISQPKLHWWVFSGAVLSTILVDSLFYLAASFA